PRPRPRARAHRPTRDGQIFPREVERGSLPGSASLPSRWPGDTEAGDMGMDRRAFLRRTGLLCTAAVLGDTLLGACAPPVDFEGIGREYHPSFVPEGSILDLPASESPIDTVVILMMENRSFDHYLGWLGRDGDYLERGVRNYGPTFRIDARSHQTYLT